MAPYPLTATLVPPPKDSPATQVLNNGAHAPIAQTFSI